MEMTEQLFFGGIAIFFGLWGLLAPYEWNIMKLKRSFRGAVSESTNRLIPKVMGAIFLVAGIAMIAVEVLAQSR